MSAGRSCLLFGTKAKRDFGTHGSLPNAGEGSPVRPSLPRPRTPVVDELIRLGLGVDPDAAPFEDDMPPPLLDEW